MNGGETPLAHATRVVVPVLVGVAFLAVWEAIVHFGEVRPFVLPAPSSIWASLTLNFGSLMAFLLAAAGGIGLAILFSQSRRIEMALFPYAVALQVTPVVAIAPLILIWVGYDRIELAVLILAWIVAFFPILSNTTLGLRSADHNLRDLFRLYGASRWQILTELQLPSALPYILAGMKISGGLALIGAVVAEFVAGSGTGTGLAWRIVEAGYRLDIPRMFAALFLLSGLGIAIFFSLTWVEHLLLRRWHESAVRREF